MKKAERRLTKLIRKTVAITDGMDKCEALEWLKELSRSINFQIGVIEDDIRGVRPAEDALSKLKELQDDHRKERKRAKKAA